MNLKEMWEESGRRVKAIGLSRKIEKLQRENEAFIRLRNIEDDRIRYQRVALATLGEEFQAAYFQNKAAKVEAIATQMIQSEAGAVVYNETLLRCYRVELDTLQRKDEEW